MSELIVNQVLRIFYENSIIPALKAEITELRKYKTLFENARITVKTLNGLGIHEREPTICHKCIKIVDDNENWDFCKICHDFVCSDCKLSCNHY